MCVNKLLINAVMEPATNLYEKIFWKARYHHAFQFERLTLEVQLQPKLNGTRTISGGEN